MKLHFFHALLIALLVACLAGCENDSDHSSSEPISGTWKGTVDSTLTAPVPTTLQLTQDGNNVSGTWDGYNCSGTFDGTTLTLHADIAGLQVQASGRYDGVDIVDFEGTAQYGGSTIRLWATGPLSRSG